MQNGHPVAMDRERAAIFASETLTDAQFDQLTGNGVAWLSVGASLLRGALILLRQVEADHRYRLQSLDAGDLHGSMPAALALQSIMFAAMATEDALKAVVAVSKGISLGGRLAVRGLGHDLEHWATEAGIEATGVEVDALREGKRFIEWVGRYPSPTSASGLHAWADLNIARLVQAYRDIFVRAAKRVAEIEHDNEAEITAT